jgi:hypothetical protein
MEGVMLRKRFARIAGLLALLGVLLAVTSAPTAAYYGEIEGVRYFDVGQGNMGCEVGFYVLQYQKVQVFCDIYQPWNGVQVARTNYLEYSCPEAWGCYYVVRIYGIQGAYPVDVHITKKDWNAGQHALIYTYRQVP